MVLVPGILTTSYERFWLQICTDQVMGRQGVNWIDLVQNREKWQVFLNTVTNFWVLKTRGVFLLAQVVLMSQERHSSAVDYDGCSVKSATVHHVPLRT
jgi:hypothetical protein